MTKNIYDEKVYLKGNKEALEEFEKRRRIVILLYATERFLYSNIIDEYKKYIDKIVGLLRSLELNNSIDYSIALRYLIEKGYLSHNMDFVYVVSDNEIKQNCGINIVLGNGCCRNFSEFLKDVMNGLGESAEQFYCNSKTPKQLARVSPADHVLNLISYEDTLYGMDLYNCSRLYRFDDPFTLKHISCYLNTSYRYKPYYDIIEKGYSIEEIKANLERFRKESRKPHISLIEYVDIMEKLCKYLDKQEDMFWDFRSDTKDLRENIHEGMELKRIRQMELTKQE